jgi:hypothetical protein
LLTHAQKGVPGEGAVAVSYLYENC